MHTREVTNKTIIRPSVGAIRAVVEADFAAVNAQVMQSLHSNVALISEVGHYIVNSGGKRLRPLLVLLSAKAFAYEGEKHIQLAAVIEFIHTATLLHDDVVDGSHLRRGRKTANAMWGNEVSVLVGDFLYTRAFQIMVGLENLAIMQLMANTTNLIAEGEVLQLINRNDADASEERYMDVIRHKTAVLFSAASQLGAMIAGQSQAIQQQAADYGMHVGIAFQLIDDVLDYTSSHEAMGKNMGDDLAEGKPTLPLIYAIKQGTPKQAALIRSAIQKGGLDNLAEILTAIHSTQAFAYCQKVAMHHVQLALNCLKEFPPGIYRSALHELAQLAVDRSS